MALVDDTDPLAPLDEGRMTSLAREAAYMDRLRALAPPGLRPARHTWVLHALRERNALCALLLESEQGAEAMASDTGITDYHAGSIHKALDLVAAARERLRALRSEGA
jgi:transketolase C-terminal domain/subunit